MHRSIHAFASILALSVLAAGCGGGGSKTDFGAPSTVYPAPHALPPQVGRLGGASGVMAAPKLVAVTYAEDPNRASWEDFTSKIGGSTYWTATTAQYGVGAATALTAIHREDNSEAAPTSTTVSAVEAQLIDDINSGAPGFSQADTNTVFLLYFPVGTTITGGGGTSCSSYGAFHSVAGGSIIYALIPTCHVGFITDVQNTTVSASHEAVEAVTDPSGNGFVGSSGFTNGAWDAASFDLELGDYCEYQPDAYVQSDFGYLVQASWSNSEAAAGHNPCAPTPGVYFGASPKLTATATIDFGGGFGVQTPAIKIAAGKTGKVELDLFSDADTGGPFVIHILDAAALYTGSAEVTGSLDRTTGVNGEKVHATLTRVKNANGNLFTGGSLVFVDARKSNAEYLWPFWVSQ